MIRISSMRLKLKHGTATIHTESVLSMIRISSMRLKLPLGNPFPRGAFSINDKNLKYEIETFAPASTDTSTLFDYQ